MIGWRSSLILIALAIALEPSAFAQSQIMFDMADPQEEYSIGTSIPTLCPVRVALRPSPIFMTVQGYAPVTIRVRPAVGMAFAQNGVLDVQLSNSAYGGDHIEANVSIPVRVGEAYSDADIVLNCPSRQGNLQFECRWNGVSMRHLQTFGYVTWVQSYSSGYGNRLVLLSDHSASQNDEYREALRTLRNGELPMAVQAIKDQGNNTSINAKTALTWKVHLVEATRIPEQWLQLAAFEQIVVDRPTLEQLTDAGWKVLREYIWCGGNLVITEVTDRQPLKAQFQADWQHPITIEGCTFDTYRMGFGSVSILPNAISKSIDRWPEYPRNERLSGVFADDYWMWLIPEVGKTPVWSFFTILFLVVAIASPGILIWSQRIQRRIWIVLGVPLLAIVSIVSLFAYGTFKDGWTSRVRIRSLTFIDRDGDGAVWSRQTYFTSNVPDNRIEVRPDTEVIPIRNRQNTRIVQHFDRENQSYSGIVVPRQQRQVSIAHPVHDLKVLAFGTRANPSDGLPQAKNISAMHLRAIACSNEEGRVFRAVNVAPGALISWEEQELSATEWRLWLNREYAREPLELPTDAPVEGSRSIIDFFYGRYSYYAPSSLAPTEFTEEKTWKDVLEEWGPEFPKKFVAFVDHAPHLDRCIPNTSETSSLHTVVGRW